MIDSHQLKDLAAEMGCEVPLDRVELLLKYLDAMLLQNESVNLTAVRERESAVLFHALDSLSLGCSPLELGAGKCLDIGTGNGFPGVAVACLFPEATVLLMDRTLKKLRAIELALQQAGFDPKRIGTRQMDASEAPAHGLEKTYQLITNRAVGTPREMGKLAKPLLAKGGELFCWLAEDTEAPPQLPGDLRLQGQMSYRLPAPADRQRRLVCYR